MTEPEVPDCDHGWVHVCGGPHDMVTVTQEVQVRDEDGQFTGENEIVEVPQMRTPYAEGGCQTVRCPHHCSCFRPDGVHEPECALATA